MSVLPQYIVNRIKAITDANLALIAVASAKLVTPLPPRIALICSATTMTGSLMSTAQRAQSIGFVTRFQHLPDAARIIVTSNRAGWHIKNFDELRYILSDFRPLIQNQSDSVFYTNVHKAWRRTLFNQDPTQGLMVRAYDPAGRDITAIYALAMGENREALSDILKAVDFGYLYNGVLQHSASDFAQRFFDDYTSGELNYVIIRHIQVLGFIKSTLVLPYRLASSLMLPALGSL